MFRLSRDTVGKMGRFSVPLGYVPSKPPGLPRQPSYQGHAQSLIDNLLPLVDTRLK
jgi:hypothetical protein